MPASLRIEIFPSNLRRMIDFYSNVLQFKLVKHESNYAYLKRDNVFIGAVETPSSETFEEKESYRRPNKGVEIVIEVEDLEKERDFIVSKGSTLDADIASQPWGLKDFRLVDPDGYVGDKVNEATSGASKEANKNVAKDSDASVGTRASAAKDALGDKVDESKNSASAEGNKQAATH
ncbi:hypothetical protein PV05_05371 [Exophiala xenobiotica]|uniref:VOC domain-containing protein n=1 Tax=Exophiala xenobiotica TaxID=348802 RepID=A0A0D2EPT0_9EURO|nr:uncharacterized protein PV05_05371 [Exophiala xenobiotica]KIW56735.1 hypothetical protein PV05_05371 [Exophiala xenobiotica]